MSRNRYIPVIWLAASNQQHVINGRSASTRYTCATGSQSRATVFLFGDEMFNMKLQLLLAEEGQKRSQGRIFEKTFSIPFKPEVGMCFRAWGTYFFTLGLETQEQNQVHDFHFDLDYECFVVNLYDTCDDMEKSAKELREMDWIG